MKQLSTIFTAVLVLLITSCNQNKPAEDKTAVTTAPKPAFTPYKAMMITHDVKDFDKWDAVFTSHDSMRKAHGLTLSYVGRGLDDERWTLILSTATDIQRAEEYATSPERKAAMKQAGVDGPSTVTYVDVLRDDTSTIPQQERVMVTHHVKDFDAWLKAYDNEGMQTRAANGMVDRFLARGIDDPNTVTLLFAITDMAKAKARIASEELKKIMTDAGVDSPPQISYFKWVK
jgi:hypothetical protein